MDFDHSLNTRPSPEQKLGLMFILKHKNVGIRFGTGLGKTYIIILASILLLKKNEVDAVFIFHSKSAYDAFHEDFSKRTKINPIFQDPQVGWISDQKINLIQYSHVKKFEENILNEKRRIAGFFDEIQILKGNPAKSSFKLLMGEVREVLTQVVGVTATPLSNDIMDIFWLTNFIRPGYFGSPWSFKSKYCHLIKKKRRDGRSYNEVTGYKNLEELRERVNEVWISASRTLPLKLNLHNIGLLSSSEENDYLLAAKGITEEKEFRLFVNRLPELQTIVDTSETKLKYVQDLIKGLLNRGDGVIVFSSLKIGLRLLKDRLNMGDNVKMLTGETSRKDRTEMRKWLSKGKVLLLTPAGAESLNFHSVNQAVLFTVPFELKYFIQFIGRVNRPLVSEYDHVDVHIPYVENTIDYYRFLMLQMNASLLKKILEGGDPNLPKEFLDVKRNLLKKMRKDLLWRVKSFK